MKDILDALHLKAYVEPEEAETFQEAQIIWDQLACMESLDLALDMMAQLLIESI